MKISRRNLSFLLPALAAAQPRPSRPALTSSVYHHEKIAYEGDPNKKGRRFFFGANHSGFNFEMHETVLGPGIQTHPPHKHEHEEFIIILEGTVEVYQDGKTEVAEAGSVVVQGSNQMHSLRNVGKGPCRYYIVEVRGALA
jgi:quercetin dioxygenase-like cupin family protein